MAQINTRDLFRMFMHDTRLNKTHTITFTTPIYGDPGVDYSEDTERPKTHWMVKEVHRNKDRDEWSLVCEGTNPDGQRVAFTFDVRDQDLEFHAGGYCKVRDYRQSVIMHFNVIRPMTVMDIAEHYSRNIVLSVMQED